MRPKKCHPKKNARGIVTLNGDGALESAAKELAVDFDTFIAKTASEL